MFAKVGVLCTCNYVLEYVLMSNCVNVFMCLYVDVLAHVGVWVMGVLVSNIHANVSEM